MGEDIKKELEDVAAAYPNIDVKSARWSNGQLTLDIGLRGGRQLSPLPEGVEVISAESLESPTGDMLGEILPAYERSSLRTIELDPLSRDYLDLARPSVSSSEPRDLYRRSIDYYRTKDVYGTAINVLTNFAAKGFENDIDDITIKNFYDNWVVDVGFDDIVEKIFFDFFRVGLVRTYKVIGQYIPKVNHLSVVPGQRVRKVKKSAGKALGQKGNRFTGDHLPIAYTVLNPTMVDIKGSLLFGQTATFLKAKAGEELKALLELDQRKLSTFQKKILKNLPAEFKKAVKEGKDIPLDPDLVGSVDYRRQPYERYPLPRGIRAYEPVEFKEELRKADYSTLDGITNYILKITVGNDNFPVTKQETLERAAEMFETVSKSYKVVWNHTLNVEKITSPEIGEILGEDKYKQVNRDITAGVGLIRALVDGTGDSNPAAAELAVKAVIEEINYARRQVLRWIYSEYRAVAETMGFERFPSVRFDDMALRDELAMMSIIQGMIDRRIISYRTGQKKLGFDPDTELAQLRTEKKLVLDGDLGLVGSPFQQSSRTVQPVQRTPRGTPSEGRPRQDGPGKTPAPKDKTAPPKADQAALDDYEAVVGALEQMSLDELEGLLSAVVARKKESE